DIRAKRKLGRHETMATAVACQKSHANAIQSSCEQRVGRGAEWCFDFDFTDIGETFHMIEAAPADDPDFGLFHIWSVQPAHSAIWRGAIWSVVICRRFSLLRAHSKEKRRQVAALQIAPRESYCVGDFISPRCALPGLGSLSDGFRPASVTVKSSGAVTGYF